MPTVIVVIKDLKCVAPDYTALRAQFMDRVNNPITFKDNLQLESQASGRLKALSVHLVFKFLTDTLEFDFDNYKYKSDAVFCRPTSTSQLATGHAFATSQYMLDYFISTKCPTKATTEFLIKSSGSSH
jgi:hypothetical protein